MAPRRGKRKKNTKAKSVFRLPELEVFRRLKRWKRSKKSNRKNSSKNLSAHQNKSLVNIIRTGLQLSILGLLLLIIIALFLPLIRFMTADMQNLAWDWDDSAPVVTSERLNILLVVYEDNSQYSFVDFLGLLSFDPSAETLQLVYINTKLATSFNDELVEMSKITAKAAAIGVSPYSSLVERTESMLGMQVDRYLAVSKEGLGEIFSILDTQFVAESDIVDSDFDLIEEGELLSGDLLANYLAADQPGVNLKNRRFSSFVKDFLKSNQSLVSAIRVYANTEDILKLLFTNLDKDELLSLVNHIWLANSLQVEYIDIFDTLLYQSGNNKYYVPNTSIVDEKVKDLFSSNSVKREQARIEIYNGSKTTGLASKHRRWLSNLGANVVRAANSPDSITQTVVYNPSESYSENIELIKWVTRGKVMVLNEVYPYNHTAELVVVLGSDLVDEEN